ncbi:MAG TPA: hypothetical protein VG937_05890 [Polyangiaceae bacterium]|jgi:hypothetical protein|nr:hypothetical protein [Polyangiaceae bacterium]
MQKSRLLQRCLGSSALLLLFACGSTSKDDSTATGGRASDGGTDPGTGGKAATGGTSQSTGGVTESGGKSSTGGTSQHTGGTASTGGASQNTGGSTTTGGSAGGVPSGLVDCDVRKVVCRIATPTCSAGQVPSVNGTCYGPCVQIDSCACSSAAECPNNDEYTCWGGKHCGPYVD